MSLITLPRDPRENKVLPSETAGEDNACRRPPVHAPGGKRGTMRVAEAHRCSNLHRAAHGHRALGAVEVVFLEGVALLTVHFADDVAFRGHRVDCVSMFH